MKNFIKVLAIGFISISGLQQAHAISIEFDYSYDTNGFFSDVARRNSLESAASYFENHFNDNLTAINSAEANQFEARFFHPGTGDYISESSFNVQANTLHVFAGGRNLSGSSIGIGGPGGYGISGFSDFFDNAISRGQGDGTQAVTQGISAYDFAPWGGSISFDNETSWYFDSDVSTLESFSENDFYSVALHELGHLLGFGTADSWENLVSNGSFIGTNSSSENNGNPVLLTATNSHWQEGTLSLVDGLVSQEAAMDPTIFTGTRKYFTDLDVAGLIDIGWEVSAVPVPAAIYFFGSALLGLGAFRKQAQVNQKL